MPSTPQPLSQYTFGPSNGGGDIVHLVNSINQITAWIDDLGQLWPTPGGSGSTAKVTLTGQTASIGTTTLYAVPASGAGMYAVYMDVIVTATDTGTVMVTVSWNNGTTAAAFQSQAFSFASQAEQSALLGNFMAIANQNITYSTTLSGTSTTAAYSLALRLQYLG